MKKYHTRPIDFTGCHPVIAEALKRSEAIECLVWDKKGDVKREVWTCRYKVRSDFPYLSEPGVFWKHAEPIARKVKRKVKRIMPFERAIPMLIAEGWRFMSSNGAMCGPNGSISHEMFRLMGRSLDDHCVGDWSWPPCIIEEVEDDA